MSEGVERFAHNAKRYLASAENRRGKLDFKAFDTATAFDSAFEELNCPGYVASGAAGSRTRRFQRIDKADSSDSDVIFFYDLSQIEAEDFIDAHSILDTYTSEAILSDQVRERDIHPLLTPVDQAHVEEVIEQVLKGEPLIEERLGYIFGPTVIGKKAERYQRSIARRIRLLSDTDQEKVIDALATAITKEESGSDSKIRNRTKTPAALRKGVAVARTQQWKEQLRQAIAVYSRQ